MMIFPKLKTEKVLQVKDTTRLCARKSIYKDILAVTKVEIKTDASEAYVDITNDDSDLWYLDFMYATPGEKVVTLRMNEDDTLVDTSTISVMDEATDNLFSSDADIEGLERELSYYWKDGRTSHLDMHREAQKSILEELYNRGVTTSSGDKLTKENIVMTDELHFWSKYLTLSFIYRDILKSEDDAIAMKYQEYKQLAKNASNAKQFLKIDLDNDGDTEVVDTGISWAEVVRR